MNIPDITQSEYLNSADYQVGTVFPARKITRIELKKAPSGKGEKAVIHLQDVPKPWMCSSRVTLREMGKVLGLRNIDKVWIGAAVSLKVVDGIRRPDGTVGTAFRVASVTPASASAGAESPKQEGGVE
jgi:hypothetical protein